jgi:hypothetical protein
MLAAACVDGGSPLMPSPENPAAVAIPVLECTVDVTREEMMSCVAPETAQSRLAVAANRMIGGQDVYVRLSNSGNSYSGGVFSTSVTVQNLLAAPLGTVDGTTAHGIRVFFTDGPTSVGAGDVSVANATGNGFFTQADQPYFLFPQVLQPYEISAAQTWQFSTTTGKFTFKVAVSAPQTPADELLPLLDRLWLGTASTAWTLASNWQSGLVPDSASTVSVPAAASMSGSFMPVLADSVQLQHLRVGSGSTLGLGGFRLTAWGNVDAVGSIGTGTVWMRGSGTLLRGTVPTLRITGSVAAQGTTTATGPVQVTGGGANGGALTLSNTAPLTIINPTP